MTKPNSFHFDRRTVLKGAAAAAALQFAPPFLIKARGESPCESAWSIP
ncbi:twin-arginine translocation signal domain-containing protein [Cupriavidus basilensis]